MPTVVVVGAGIVGASIAYHLARRGAAVTVVDSGRPAGGVTGRAFGWINVAHGGLESGAPLRRAAAEDWRRLQRELGELLGVRWGGALSWCADPADTARLAADCARDGYPVRLVGPGEIAAIEPGLLDPPACAIHAAGDGAVQPAAATDVLLAAVREAGGRIAADARVTGLLHRGERVAGVRSGGEELTADAVVVAAGLGTVALCRPLGVELPVSGSPALLLRFDVPRRLVRGVISAPDLEVRQEADGTLLAAADHPDDADDDEPRRTAERVRAAIGQRLHGGSKATIRDAVVGVRPMPADGLPIVGPVRGVAGLYLAAMHSGVTLAAIVGRLAADEVADGSRSPLLEFYRPERFLAPTMPRRAHRRSPDGDSAHRQ